MKLRNSQYKSIRTHLSPKYCILEYHQRRPLGPLAGGSQCHMSILRKGNVALSNFKNAPFTVVFFNPMSHVTIFINPMSHVPCHYVPKRPISPCRNKDIPMSPCRFQESRGHAFGTDQVMRNLVGLLSELILITLRLTPPLSSGC